MIAEEYPNDEIEKAFNFCIKCGIPVTLEDLGIDNDNEKLKLIAKSSLTASSWEASTYVASEESIISLIRATDCLGKYYKAKYKI